MIIITFPYSQGPRQGNIVAALWANGTADADVTSALEYARTRPGYCVHVFSDPSWSMRGAKLEAIAQRDQH